MVNEEIFIIICYHLSFVEDFAIWFIRMSVSSERGFYNVLNRILTFSVLHNIVLAIYTN